MKFCFVILHYLNLEDTVKCVSSIDENILYPEYYIVIVDNASPDGSGEKLEKLYGWRKKIAVLRNSDNLGYARGNNSGAKYAIKKFSPDFICVINNDTEIKQANFIEIIIDRYNKKSFHFLGPDIISKSGSQNPYVETMTDLKSANKGLRETKRLLFLNYLHLDKVLLKYVEIKHKYIRKNVIDRNKVMYNVGLHGACLVFSKDYIYKYPNLFYDETFLYMEENILSYVRKRDRLTSLYFPQAKVFHSEDGSINQVFKKETSKRRAIYKLRIDSINKFKKLIKNPELFHRMS